MDRATEFSPNFPRDQTFPGAVGFSPIQAKTFQEIQKNCREIQKTFPGQLASQPVGVGKRENRVWNRGQVGGREGSIENYPKWEGSKH